MAGSIWKGHITFGLVNVPVILYSAEKKSEVQFKLLDNRDKSRIRYVRVNEETGKEVPWEDIAKGFEYDKGQFVVVKEAELKAIASENIKAINIETFINKSSVDMMDFEKPYYLVPNKGGEKGYVILREALKDTKKIGIAKVIIHTREYLAALYPYQDALVLNVLRYHQELKKPTDFTLPSKSIKEYKISPKEMIVAKELVNSMTTKWDPTDFHDQYQEALQSWLSEKIHHEKPHTKMKSKAGVQPGKGNMVNFIDLLKKSIADQKTHKRVKPIKMKMKTAKTKKHHHHKEVVT